MKLFSGFFVINGRVRKIFFFFGILQNLLYPPTPMPKLELINLEVCMIIQPTINSHSWPAQPDDPSTIRVASVIAFSVCLFSVTFF